MLAGAPSGAQNEQVIHVAEIAIVGDECRTALLERDGELERVRQLQCVSQP